MLRCSSCGKEYDPKAEKHVPKISEETRGMLVIRFSTGCTVEKV